MLKCGLARNEIGLTPATARLIQDRERIVRVTAVHDVREAVSNIQQNDKTFQHAEICRVTARQFLQAMDRGEVQPARDIKIHKVTARQIIEALDAEGK